VQQVRDNIGRQAGNAARTGLAQQVRDTIGRRTSKATRAGPAQQVRKSVLRVTDRVADAGPAQPARWFVLQAAYNFGYKAPGVRRGLGRSQSGGLYRRSLTRPRRTVRSQVVCIAGRLQGRGGRSGAASQVVSTTVRLQGSRGRSSQPSWQYVLFCSFFSPSQMQQHHQARRQTQQHGEHQIAGVRAVWAAPLVTPQLQHVRQRNIAGVHRTLSWQICGRRSVAGGRRKKQAEDVQQAPQRQVLLSLYTAADTSLTFAAV